MYWPNAARATPPSATSANSAAAGRIHTRGCLRVNRCRIRWFADSHWRSVMKRIILFVVGVVAISSSPSAQAPNDAVATPLLGLPAHAREGATVIKWKTDQHYAT